jgi:hypothetical protein
MLANKKVIRVYLYADVQIYGKIRNNLWNLQGFFLEIMVCIWKVVLGMPPGQSVCPAKMTLSTVCMKHAGAKRGSFKC